MLRPAWKAVTSKRPPTLHNFVRIVKSNEAGQFPSGDPTAGSSCQPMRHQRVVVPQR
jgi:hypothetical protein